ncbi:YqzL family protein [Oceanobacillus sp. CAU 1775]
MLDTTWKVFTQTGNIETYLLLKEMENVRQTSDLDTSKTESNIHYNIEEVFQK